MQAHPGHHVGQKMIVHPHGGETGAEAADGIAGIKAGDGADVGRSECSGHLGQIIGGDRNVADSMSWRRVALRLPDFVEQSSIGIVATSTP